MGWAYFFGRVGGWLEIWRAKLISTQVVVEEEVGVELGKIFNSRWKELSKYVKD